MTRLFDSGFAIRRGGEIGVKDEVYASLTYVKTVGLAADLTGADPLIASYGEFYPPSHLLSIYENGNIAAGFITRGDGLAIREHPSLML